MNLLIDVGNTRLKAACFDDDGNLRGFVYGLKDLLKFVEEGRFDIFVSGSGDIESYDLKNLLSDNYDVYMEFSRDMHIPLEIAYASPTTLGMDRIADCVAAKTMYPDTDILVIDMGTAITYNYVDSSGLFLGGNIAPGVSLRFKSLNDYTANLPLLSAQSEWETCGHTTDSAIIGGVMNGVYYELKTYIDNFLFYNGGSSSGNRKILVSGGASVYFDNKFTDYGADVVFVKNLGLYGLNHIFEINKSFDVSI